ncbi:MAG: hypothetical protein N2D54_11795, partial [Chloroflexota bacterium]
GTAIPPWLLKFIPPYRGMQKMINDSIWDKLFDGRFEEREYAIGIFEAHIDEVKRVVPSEKLLIFQVKDGWEPLCKFLGVTIPARPFPHVNDRKMTKRMYLGARIFSAALIAGVIWVTIWIISLLIKL